MNSQESAWIPLSEIGFIASLGWPNMAWEIVVQGQVVPQPINYFIFKDFMYLFLKRGEGREKEKERNIDVREKHLSVPPHMYPGWGSNPQLRHVSWLESNWWPFTLWYVAQPTEPHWLGLHSQFRCFSTFKGGPLGSFFLRSLGSPVQHFVECMVGHSSYERWLLKKVQWLRTCGHHWWPYSPLADPQHILID